ncbi:VanW family protein [Mesobacillus thioparans]|uniref:VanW family protein n=1 Tax=Mesobacillus thioparans TaxID=370439 RepID=UPI0039F0D364
MRTRQIVKFPLILSVFSIFIFSFSFFGSSVIGTGTSANQVFSENTFIGGTDVSDKSKDDATKKLHEHINNWMSEAKINLVYKGQIYPIESSSFSFFIEESVDSAISGTENELQVKWKEGAFNNLALPTSVKSKLDAEELNMKLEAAVQKLNPLIEMKLEEFLPAEEHVIISTASIKLSNAEEQEVKGIIEGFNQIEVSPESMFSLIAYAEDTKQAEGSAKGMNLIASALYKSILPTNIAISERHISSVLPENIELGYEAKLDFTRNLDLKFYNPNESAIKITFLVKGQELYVTVSGTPQIYEYKVTASGKQEVKPRVIKQYSPLLTQGQKSVEKEGQSGLLIRMNREIYGEKGNLLKSEFISEDFYPPVHRVEVLPIAPHEVQLSTDQVSGSPIKETVVGPGTDNPEQTGEKPSSQENNSGGQQSESDQEQNMNNDQNKDEDGLWGKPNEEPK